MKIGLQNIEKGTDTINGFLQRIKAARDWLLAVGVTVDNEELICIVLRGLPKEYAQIFIFYFFYYWDSKLIIHMKKFLLKMPKEICILWQCIPHQTRAECESFTGIDASKFGGNQGRARNSHSRGGGGRFI